MGLGSRGVLVLGCLLSVHSLALAPTGSLAVDEII